MWIFPLLLVSLGFFAGWIGLREMFDEDSTGTFGDPRLAPVIFVLMIVLALASFPWAMKTGGHPIAAVPLWVGMVFPYAPYYALMFGRYSPSA